MRTTDRDVLEQLDGFFDQDVENLFKNGFQGLKKLMKKEIRLARTEKKSKLLEYNPDSPFSYLAAFLRDKAVASVAPSTKYVIKRVVKAMDLKRARVVVEYGPAEGVITRRILAELPADGVLMAVERNANFVKALNRIRDPKLRVVQGDVQDIDEILRAQRLDGADVIVSGIPFSFFDPPGRRRLLGKTCGLLNRGGRFVAYQFTTHLIPLLKYYFREVDTQLELRNLPPHFVFTCLK